MVVVMVSTMEADEHHGIYLFHGVECGGDQKRTRSLTR